MIPKNTICLWFNNDAEEAKRAFDAMMTMQKN